MTRNGFRPSSPSVSRPAARGRLAPLAALCAAALLAGCQSSADGGGAGSTLRNFALYAGPTVPPEAPLPTEEFYCPAFDVFEGGSAVRSGEGRSLRHQLSIRGTARECIGHADGSRTVNVGVEVLGLLGPAGSPGTVSAPLHIAVKRGNAVLDRRTRQVSIPIPAGTAQNAVSVIEEGLRLPDDTTNVTIEIGLGGQPARSTRR